MNDQRYTFFQIKRIVTKQYLNIIVQVDRNRASVAEYKKKKKKLFFLPVWRTRHWQWLHRGIWNADVSKKKKGGKGQRRRYKKRLDKLWMTRKYVVSVNMKLSRRRKNTGLRSTDIRVFYRILEGGCRIFFRKNAHLQIM